VIWRSGDELLVAHADAFWLVDGTGAIKTRYEPSRWGDRDGISYRVVDDELRADTTVSDRVNSVVVLSGLVLDTDSDTARFVAMSVGDHVVTRESERTEARRAGDARVAAIEGAYDYFELGLDFARAQIALRKRVQADDCTLFAALLRTLVDLARARANPSAIAAYVRGCLIACNVRDVPPLTVGKHESSSIAADVNARGRELEAEARRHGSSWDGNQYGLAAAAVRAAARLLT
jgi:hypothetical protein